jgi:hypothetical protein
MPGLWLSRPETANPAAESAGPAHRYNRHICARATEQSIQPARVNIRRSDFQSQHWEKPCRGYREGRDSLNKYSGT